MKKLSFVLLLLIVCSYSSNNLLAQAAIKPDWLINPPVAVNGGAVHATAITTTKSGYTYVTGSFNSTGDFDPGAGTYNLSAQAGNAIFVAKYDKGGKIVFAFSVGGDGVFGTTQPAAIATDDSDNIYLYGSYGGGNTDFDPGAGTAILPAGYYDTYLFFAKYSKDGNLIFAKGITGGESDYPTSLVIDNKHNIYIAGETKSNTTDFDPGAAVVHLRSALRGDAFFAKYDASGNFLFVKNVGGSSYDEANGIALDKQNNILIAGFFGSSDADFDPGPQVVNLPYQGADDIFFAKYDSAGNYIYAHSIGGKANDDCAAIATDAENNVIITGYFRGSNVDFDPGADSALRSCKSGNSDVYIAKYNPQGNFLFADAIGGKGADYATGILTDNSSNIYITGTFSETCDFDPSSAMDTLTSKGGDDVFFAKYTKTGSYVQAYQVGGTGSETASGIALQNDGKIVVAGVYRGSVDVDPAAPVYTLSSQGISSFLATYSKTGLLTNAGSIGNYRNFEVYSSVDATAIDDEGNTYITGAYQGKLDFDPGPDTFFLTSVTDYYNQTDSYHHDIFFAKYDKNGKLVFAKSIGGIYSNSVRTITVDKNHSIYLCGYFSVRADFDPGPDSAILISENRYGDATHFFAKYDSNGNYVFAKKIQMNLAYGGDISGIAIDDNSNIYLDGDFYQAKFDPASDVNTKALGRLDLFLAKYDVNGNFTYVKTMGQKGEYLNFCSDLKLSNAGQLLLCGTLQSTHIDFDPNEGTYYAGIGKGYFAHFVAGYTLDGNFLFESNSRTAANSQSGASKLALMGTDFLVCGYYTGTLDFDPGPDSSIATGNFERAGNGFFAKYNREGKFLYGKYIVPDYKYDYINPNFVSFAGMTVDKNRNIYLAGSINGRTDMDPSPDSAFVGPTTNPNSFINVLLASYDSLGNYRYAYQFDATDTFINIYNQATDCEVDSDGNILIGGNSNGSIDFDPGPDTFFFRPGYTYTSTIRHTPSLFLVKYTQNNLSVCPPPDSLFTTNISANSAKLNWHYSSGSQGFQVFYKIKGTASWTKVSTSQPSVTIRNLQSATTYVWKVRAKCATDNSLFSSETSFITLANLQDAKVYVNNIAGIDNHQSMMNVTPNPVANHSFQLHLFLPDTVVNSHVNLFLYSSTGGLVWSRGMILNNHNLDLKINLPASVLQGTYFLQAAAGSVRLNQTIVVAEQ